MLAGSELHQQARPSRSHVLKSDLNLGENPICAVHTTQNPIFTDPSGTEIQFRAAGVGGASAYLCGAGRRAGACPGHQAREGSQMNTRECVCRVAVDGSQHFSVGIVGVCYQQSACESGNHLRLH